MHAMTGINYVKNGNVSAAKALSAQLMDGFVYQQGYIFDKNLANNNEYLAYFNLGMGMHPLMDQWSPAHSGFQVWDPNDFCYSKCSIVLWLLEL